MKKQTKIFLSLVIAALTFAAANDSHFQTSAQAETPTWITKVTDSVTGIFSDRELNAIKKIQSLRTQFPDIISEETSQKIQNYAYCYCRKYRKWQDHTNKNVG